MPKLRLNQNHRQQLRRLVNDVVTPPQATVEAVDKAYRVAAAHVRTFLQRKFPPKDMLILERYKAAAKDFCIHFTRGEDGVRRFDFRADDNVPLIPETSHTYRIKPYPVTDTLALLLDDFERAEQAMKTATEKARAPYLSLVEYQAKTFEDVAEVWPEAEQLRKEFEAPPLPVPISAVKDRIAEDMARRAREAEKAKAA